MRLLHVPFTYFPSSCGGTEFYVAALCRELSAEGITCIIAAPDATSSSYDHDGIPVHRFSIDPAPGLETVNGGGDPAAASAFGQIIDQTAPDIVHFHAYSPAVSHLALRETRRRGVPTLFTYHTATATCNRGTLMRWGTEPCDGKLRAGVCAACHLHGLGVPRPLAAMFTALSPALRFAAPWLPCQARWQLPARALQLTRSRHANIREWLGGQERIIALNAWTEKLLRLNDMPAQRIRKVRHGLTQAAAPAHIASIVPPASGRPLSLVFLGRLDLAKGLDVILEALRQVPDLPLTLDLYTIISDPSSLQAVRFREKLAEDPRIRIRAPLPAAQVIDALRHYDALLSPSQGFETGPLVVLEAFAAGLPVLGSNLGGIAEWVTHEHDGLLLPHDSPAAWATALQMLVKKPDLLSKWSKNIRQPRSMREVALDMIDIYRELRPAAS